jgi:hypothetical protein
VPARARRGACSARGRGGAGAGRVGRLRCRGLERRGTQFTCFTGTKVPILTPEELLEPLHSIVISCDGQGGQPSWHVRTVSVRRHRSSSSPPHTYRFEWNDWVGAPQGAGTPFTCFTGTQVQILTQKALPERSSSTAATSLQVFHYSRATKLVVQSAPYASRMPLMSARVWRSLYTQPSCH